MVAGRIFAGLGPAWLAVLILAAIYIGLDLAAAMTHAGLSLGDGAILGRDFVNVPTAGKLMLSGDLDIIYDIDRYRSFQMALWDGTVVKHNYSYPPVSFFYVWIFGALPYLASFALWNLLTGAAFFFAARPYLKDVGLSPWLAILLPGSIINLWAGHYGFLMGALWLGAWRLMETRPRVSGLLIGLMIIKPHLAVLLPIALARRGAWISFAYAGLSAAALVVLSGIIFGWSHWWTYLTVTSSFQASILAVSGDFFVTMMPTISPALFSMGLTLPVTYLVQALAAAAVVTALWVYMPRDPVGAASATACATFLILPYAFIYDLTVVSLASLLLMVGGRDGKQRPGSLLTFLLPFITVPANLVGAPIAPALIALQFIRHLDGRKARVLRGWRPILHSLRLRHAHRQA